MKSQNQNNNLAYASVGGNSPLVPRILGSACAGVSEIFLFHPVDTVAKRLMSNQGKTGNYGAVIFKDAVNKPAFQKWQSLFPGLGFAAGYKILQRVYKFGGQPYVRDWMNKTYGDQLTATFGKKTGKLLSASLAGSLMGIGEIVLLPLDVLKIKSQTNPEALKGRNLASLFSKPKELYRGASWTAARNAPGSFALFGGSAFAHHIIFGNEHTKDATIAQNFFASMCGSICSITVAAPLDVVKTRIQNKPFDAPESGVQIIRNLVRQEGFSAFFKGLTPKMLVVGPKLIFSFTVAQTMIAYFEKKLAK